MNIEPYEAWVALLPEVLDRALIGSASYMPEQANDVDFALLVDGPPEAYIERRLLPIGFEWCGMESYTIENKATWNAVRNGVLNLMVTNSREFFDGYRLAMEVCKLLRLTEKQDRIDVCKVVRDKVPADTVRPRT